MWGPKEGNLRKPYQQSIFSNLLPLRSSGWGGEKFLNRLSPLGDDGQLMSSSPWCPARPMTKYKCSSVKCFPTSVFRQVFSVKSFSPGVFRQMFSVKCFPSSVFRQVFFVKRFPPSVFRRAFSVKCFQSIAFLSNVRHFRDGGVFRQHR